jgi:hypothetical protein
MGRRHAQGIYARPRIEPFHASNRRKRYCKPDRFPIQRHKRQIRGHNIKPSCLTITNPISSEREIAYITQPPNTHVRLLFRITKRQHGADVHLLDIMEFRISKSARRDGEEDLGLFVFCWLAEVAQAGGDHHDDSPFKESKAGLGKKLQSQGKNK